MRFLGYLVGPLGCAAGIVVCMGMMARSHRGRASDDRAQGEGNGPSEPPALNNDRPASNDA